MDKCIVYQPLEGGVAVIYPAPNAIMTVAQRAATKGLTEQEYMAQAHGSGMTPSEFIATLNMTIEEIAAKDVPTGLPYKIVDVVDILADRSNRDLWEVDVADLTDGVGA